jgi:hypothetical protein
LIGFRSPDVGTGWLFGLEVASSSHPTLFLTVPEDWLGDSADEVGVMLEVGLSLLSFEKTRPKNERAFESWL